MKRLLSCGLLALCALLASQRPAHAWINSKFSVGLSWTFQSANNSLLWGLWQDGPSHGGPLGIGGDCGYGYGAPAFGPAAYPAYAPGPYPIYTAPLPAATPKTPTEKEPPAEKEKSAAAPYGTIPAWQGGNVYQSASFPGYYPAYSPGYNAGYYYYPSYGSYPSYWYGW